MSQWVRQGSNQTVKLDILPAGERVMIQGSSGVVHIAGDVGGTITVQGSNGIVKIGGVIRSSARVTIQGSNPVLKHHGRESGAIVVLQGSNAEEIDKSTPREKESRRQEAGKPPGSRDDNLAVTIQKSERPRELWGTPK